MRFRKVFFLFSLIMLAGQPPVKAVDPLALATWITAIALPIISKTIKSGPELASKAGSYLAPENKRTLSSYMNFVGASCYHIAQKLESPWRERLIDYAARIYKEQPQLATEIKKQPEILRNIILSACNTLGTGCHFMAGLQAQHPQQFNQKVASLLHTAGDKSYACYHGLNTYQGVFSNVLDNTDFSKKSHLLATILVSSVAAYSAYAVTKHCIYRPLAALTDHVIGKPSKKLYHAAIAKAQEKLGIGPKKDTENRETAPAA